MIEWTTWYDSEEATASNSSLNNFGIYQIRIVNPTGDPLHINRFCSADTNGLIYFGRSGFRHQKTNRTIANRIQEFIRRKHSGGRTYSKIKPLLDKHPNFADHRLQFRGKFLPDTEIENAEANLLSEYLFKFGELPPG